MLSSRFKQHARRPIHSMTSKGPTNWGLIFFSPDRSGTWGFAATASDASRQASSGLSDRSGAYHRCHPPVAETFQPRGLALPRYERHLHTLPIVIRNWSPDYLRLKEEMVQSLGQVVISSSDIREVRLCPPDESLQLEGKESAFISILDTLEGFLYRHALEEIGKCHDCALKVWDCSHQAFRVPPILPTLWPLPFGLKVLHVFFDPRVLKHLTKQLGGSAMIGSWPDSDFREKVSKKFPFHKRRRELVESPRC